MARPFKPTTTESHDWDARADQMRVAADQMPEGEERNEALRQLALMRAGAAMKRALS